MARNGVSKENIRKLAEIAGRSDVRTIEEVADRLEELWKCAAETSPLGEKDGIACFSRLYHIITVNVQDTAVAGRFVDRPFLTELDLQFARRYFDAIRRYAIDPGDAPDCWRVLFDRSYDEDIAPVNFAAAGVNAHVDCDLAIALLRTWETYPPSADRHRDYQHVNDIFAEEMDGLRELFGAPLAAAKDGSPLDQLGNRFSDLLVRFTRDLAWDAAMEVWRSDDRPRAERRTERRLDAAAEIVGRGLLFTLW